MAIKFFNLHDDYSIHKLVYSLFPREMREFLYCDLGGDIRGRRILILSEQQPCVPDRGKIESKALPQEFLSHRWYGFKILLNPVERKHGNKSFLPVVGKENLISWFLKRQVDWGFNTDPTHLEIVHTGVQIISKENMKITHNTAEFRGILEVTDRDKFEQAFRKGIGRGKAFGFGLLQLRRLYQ
jgi:CRISPR system Cascade subunit CasE